MKRVILLFLSLLILEGCLVQKESHSGDLPHFLFIDTDAPLSLDPRYDSYTVETRINLALFEGLMTFDPETLEPLPGVAESWEISEDGLVYTFNLRDNAKWSDGSAVTAQQFSNTWINRISPDSDYLAHINMYAIRGVKEYTEGTERLAEVGIKALSDRVFQIELSSPTPYFLNLLSNPAFLVLPLDTIEEHGEQWTSPENFVGNGPFILESHNVGEKIVMVKSGTYWDRDVVKLGRISILFMPDSRQSLEMYLSEEVDWIPDVPSESWGELLSRPDFHLNPTFTTYFYRFNMTKPPFDDIRVRKALALAVNRRELSETVLEGSFYPAYSLTPPFPSYGDIHPMEENSEKARKLLAEAGYPGGKGFRPISINFNDMPVHHTVAQNLAKTWKRELGITFLMNPLNWEDFLTFQETGKFELTRSGWYGHYLDPNAFLELFTTNNPTNAYGMANEQFDEIITRTGDMPYGTERFEKLKDAEGILLHEEIPIIPLFFYMNENCIDTSVWGGWHENVIDWHPWKWIYKK